MIERDTNTVSSTVNRAEMLERLAWFKQRFETCRDEVRKVFVGQDAAIEAILVAVFSGGHVLLTGVPGLGRTHLVKTLARVLGLEYGRIQFTPDLLPTDITGTEALERAGGHAGRFRFYKGPVFCNLLLADEVNRSPARTQAALLEAMHERQVTVGGRTFPLPLPFVVVATMNSMETDGVCRMPEAQIDRFMVMIDLRYPDEAAEIELLRMTTSGEQAEVQSVLSPSEIIRMQQLAAHVPVVPAVKRFAVDIVRASRPGADAPAALEPLIRLGASPRAAQSMLRGAKVLALVDGRLHVTRGDIRRLADTVLCHRLMLDYRSASHGMGPREVIRAILEAAERRRMPADTYRYNRKLVLRQVTVT